MGYTQSNQYKEEQKQQQNKTNPKQGHLSGGMPKQHYGGIKYKSLTDLFFLPAITLVLIIILVLSSRLTAHTQNIKSQKKFYFFF